MYLHDFARYLGDSALVLIIHVLAGKSSSQVIPNVSNAGLLRFNFQVQQVDFAKRPLSFDFIMILLKLHGIFHAPSGGLETPIFAKFEVSMKNRNDLHYFSMFPFPFCLGSPIYKMKVEDEIYPPRSFYCQHSTRL